MSLQFHFADGKEYILEVNGTSSGLVSETKAEDNKVRFPTSQNPSKPNPRLQIIAELVVDKMNKLFLQHKC